jgi:hypothetical protein
MCGNREGERNREEEKRMMGRGGVTRVAVKRQIKV